MKAPALAIADGEVEVLVGGTPVRRQARGEGFGEIALLRDVPRTATVRAVADTRLYALERQAFLVALTGHAPAAEAAEAVVRERMPPADTSRGLTLGTGPPGHGLWNNVRAFRKDFVPAAFERLVFCDAAAIGGQSGGRRLPSP